MNNFFTINLRNKKKEPKADFNQSYKWSGDNMIPFDGEKTPYELGTPLNYYLDYYRLRSRSWEAFLKSDVVQNAIKKYCLWIVGPGLKLQSSPLEKILKDKEIKIDFQDFAETVETYFRLYADMKDSIYNKEMDLHQTAAEALKNALISGDVLCVERLTKGRPNIEIIDGYYVRTPNDLSMIKEAQLRGNTIQYGVEVDKKGTHVAYYVEKDDFTFEKVLARASRTKRRQAWLMYGLKYKISNVRGMSLLSAILESASKMDRYKDATLGSAEENAKVPYIIEHDQFSDGENPLVKNLLQSAAKGKGTAPETQASFEACEPIATKVAQTTSKQVYNFPVGARLARNNFETDINFADFFNINMDIVFNTIGIPPEVALDKFGGSYSSSRAALKSWEYKMMTDRVNLLKKQYYKPFFDFWLDVNILNNNITADGYLQAYLDKNTLVLEAFRNCRFIGATVPHIDPVKEVNAERTKLGPNFKDFPLTTAEQACENLNTGDYNSIIKKAENEINISKEFIIVSDDDNNDSNSNE